MAKKFLAVLLAVMLVFSFGIPAFAADEQGTTQPEITPEPDPTEGYVFFSAKGDLVSKGRTASIPVSIISNIETEVEPEWYVVSFQYFLTQGSSYAAIKGFTFNNAILNDSNFKYLVNDYYDIFFEEAEYSGNCVSFAVKSDVIDLCHQDRFEIGTVELAIDESYPGGDQAIEVSVAPIDFVDLIHSEVLKDDFCDVMPYYDTYLGGLEYTGEGAFHGYENNVNMIFYGARCFQKTPWQDRIVNVLKKWALDILNFFQVIITALIGLLQK